MDLILLNPFDVKKRVYMKMFRVIKKCGKKSLDVSDALDYWIQTWLLDVHNTDNLITEYKHLLIADESKRMIYLQ